MLPSRPNTPRVRQRHPNRALGSPRPALGLARLRTTVLRSVSTGIRRRGGLGSCAYW